MPKITVYLPDELATRVKAANLPLSPICQRALEYELTAMQKVVTEDAEIAEAARRFLLEEDEEGRRAYEEGRRAREAHRQGLREGREWALRFAAPSELRAMQKLITEQPIGARSQSYEYDGMPHKDQGSWVSIRRMRGFDRPEAIVEFGVPGDRADPAYAYWEGFEEAALDVYGKIRAAIVTDAQ